MAWAKVSNCWSVGGVCGVPSAKAIALKVLIFCAARAFPKFPLRSSSLHLCVNAALLSTSDMMRKLWKQNSKECTEQNIQSLQLEVSGCPLVFSKRWRNGGLKKYECYMRPQKRSLTCLSIVDCCRVQLFALTCGLCLRVSPRTLISQISNKWNGFHAVCFSAHDLTYPTHNTRNPRLFGSFWTLAVFEFQLVVQSCDIGIGPVGAYVRLHTNPIPWSRQSRLVLGVLGCTCTSLSSKWFDKQLKQTPNLEIIFKIFTEWETIELTCTQCKCNAGSDSKRLPALFRIQQSLRFDCTDKLKTHSFSEETSKMKIAQCCKSDCLDWAQVSDMFFTVTSLDTQNNSQWPLTLSAKTKLSFCWLSSSTERRAGPSHWRWSCQSSCPWCLFMHKCSHLNSTWS